LFDDDLPGPDRTAYYRTPWLDLHAIPDARDRILRQVGDHQTPLALDQVLPALPDSGAPPEGGLRRRSRWTSTFVASLELPKQGEVTLDQDTVFTAIRVSRS
jgi:chromatin segregation and condensation protein Rec8/ScpA/Scc1 (kleisin family)